MTIPEVIFDNYKSRFLPFAQQQFTEQTEDGADFTTCIGIVNQIAAGIVDMIGDDQAGQFSMGMRTNKTSNEIALLLTYKNSVTTLTFNVADRTVKQS
jgi:hypothetical protein